MSKPGLIIRRLKPLVFAAGLAPAALLAWKGYQQDLGGNPIEFITHETGDWTIRFLLITLAITPLRYITSLPDLIRLRRMLGLFAFFYGTLHMLTYVWLDQFFSLSSMAHDIVKRPFITAGATGFLAMVPLAVTSTAGWIRRLGGRRWQLLHRSIYLSATAGVIHYYWLVKSDIRMPVFYGAILAMLLAFRVVRTLRRKPCPQAAATAVPAGRS
jgi:sulfoxide reductase heme-binding subunit YedZ